MLSLLSVLSVLSLSLSGATPLDADAAVARALENAHSLRVEQDHVERARKKAGRIDLRDVTVGVEDRSVSQLAAPQAGDPPAGALDNTFVEVSWRPPRLQDFGVEKALDLTKVDEDALDVDAKARDIAAETRLLHAHVLLLRTETALVADAVAVQAKIKDVIEKKVAASTATQVELSLATLDALEVHVERDEVEAKLQRAEARLGRLVGVDGALALAGELPACRAPPDAATVLAHAQARSHKLRRLALEKAELDIDGTRDALRFVPWFDKLHVSYLNARPIDAKSEVQLGVDIDLPLFRILDGQGEAHDRRRARLDADVAEANEDLASDVAALVARQKSAAALYEEQARATEQATAQSTAAVDGALASGAADAVGAATVHMRALKARRATLHARERCVEAVVDVWKKTGEVLPPHA